MLSENISVNAENALADRHRNKLIASERKGNPKARALGDVKNVLHSHSSITQDRNKPGIHSKIASNLNFDTPLKGNTRFENCKSEIASKIDVNRGEDLMEIHDHACCDKALQLEMDEHLHSEYKLSESEIEFLGDRLKLFKLGSQPFRFTPMVFDVSDIAFDYEEKRHEYSCSFNILDDLLPMSIPPPMPV